MFSLRQFGRVFAKSPSEVLRTSQVFSSKFEKQGFSSQVCAPNVASLVSFLKPTYDNLLLSSTNHKKHDEENYEKKTFPLALHLAVGLLLWPTRQKILQ